MTALAAGVESRMEAMRAADALMAEHPGAVIVPAELRRDRVGLWAHVPRAWRLGDADEVRAWLAEAPVATVAQARP